ncbi:MFS transporter [Candidatus Woesearchaeota archaeon]|nr:MFS transporter [Candidatus Woesearchaeota archaeon]
MHYKLHKLRLPLKGMPYLTTIVLINTIATSMLIPIFPLYIKNFVSNDATVGYVFSLMAVLMIVYTLIIRKILTKVKRLNLIRIGFLGSAISILIYTIISSIFEFLALQFFRIFFVIAIYISIGLFVREYAKRKEIGQSEGMYFTTLNLGFLIGPLIGGLIASTYSFKPIFIIISSVQFLITLMLLIIPLKDTSTNNEKNKLQILDFFKNKQLLLIYIINLGLVFWWNIIYTYLPLFSNNHGFTERAIGIALFLSVIPLIFLEIPIGKLADKKGFKKFIILGFIIIGLISLLTYLANPLYTIGIIVIASIGGALIEPLTEAYFFKEVKSKEDQNKLFPIYKTSAETGELVAPLIFSTVLIYSSFRGVFVFAGILMLVFAIIATRLKR